MQKITLEEYGEAVARLVPLALTHTSGGRAVAQVLLSALNGGQYQLDVTDLCNLSRDYYHLALVVIRGRVETGHEPHQVIENGTQFFDKIWDQWEGLRVAERGMVFCWDCNGSGMVDGDYKQAASRCKRCEGKGKYWPLELRGGRNENTNQ